MHESSDDLHESSGNPLAVKLRTEVFDALMASKNITTATLQANELGVDRSTLFRVRNGRVEPGVGLALKMAKLAGTSVEALFELRPAGDDRG